MLKDHFIFNLELPMKKVLDLAYTDVRTESAHTRSQYMHSQAARDSHGFECGICAAVFVIIDDTVACV